MIIEASATAVGAWGLRKLVHGAILRGLRAPRLPHTDGPAGHGVCADAVREVQIAGPRGKQLFAWMVSPPRAAPRPAPAVLVMHGWGANASMMGLVVPPLHAAGFAVLLVDARCHGRSDDEAFTSMPRFAEDIAAGLAWLRTQPGVAPDRLALLGHSVGAAAALLHASRQHDVRAVISLSAFAHPQEVMRRFMAEKRVPYPVLGWYVLRHVQRVIGASFDEIAPLNTIARVRCPTLLVHGRGDATVPVGDAKRLLAASGHAHLMLVDGDHDLRQALAPHTPALVDFLQAACAEHLPPASFVEPDPKDTMTLATETVPLIDDELDVLAELVPLAGLAIIELGCGAAGLARKLLIRHPDSRVTGVEVDERQHAKNLAAPQPGLRFMSGVAQAIPFADAGFDLALMLKSLHHVPVASMAKALSEVARVLRPGGHLYVSEPVYGGAFNEVIRLFNDEGVVRAAAQAAVDAAIKSGVWTQVAERRFQTAVRFADFADFEMRIMRPTFADHHIDDAKFAAVRLAFEPHLASDGAHFRRPMHVRLLRLAGLKTIPA